MALNIKFSNAGKSDLIFNRFKSAIKFFNIFSKKIKLSKDEVILFYGDPSDQIKCVANDFGIIEKEIRTQLKKQPNSEYIGLIIKGKIIIDKMIFSYYYELNPKILSNKENYDIRLEILPNKYAEIFEDLIKFIPNFKDIILDRIKKYNDDSKEILTIKRAILSKSGDEYKIASNRCLPNKAVEYRRALAAATAA